MSKINYLPQKQLRKKIFPAPAKFTSNDVDEIRKSYYDLDDGAKRTVLAMLFGTNHARITSSHTSYQFSARMFFRELRDSIIEINLAQKIKES